MKAIKAYTQIYIDFEGEKILKKIESAAMICYKNQENIDSTEETVTKIINSGNLSILEHSSITVKFIVDRGTSHEITRFRAASYIQESAQYCNYGDDDFNSEITFIIPNYLVYGSQGFNIWKEEMKSAEKAYFNLLDFGLLPEEASAVFPTSIKTELLMTANLNEWRNFFKLKCSKFASWQMREISIPLLAEFKSFIPIVFDDLKY